MKSEYWVLGFDGLCAGCDRLARSVQAASPRNLVVAPLQSEYLHERRSELLGPEADPEPILLRMNDDKAIKAYTGLRLGIKLLQLLGLKDGWSVLRELGTREADEGRRAFLRKAPAALGGVLVGLGVLLRPGEASALPSDLKRLPVEAEDWSRLTDEAMKPYVAECLARTDVRLLSGFLVGNHGFENRPDLAVVHVYIGRGGSSSTLIPFGKPGTRQAAIVVKHDGRGGWFVEAGIIWISGDVSPTGAAITRDQVASLHFKVVDWISR